MKNTKYLILLLGFALLLVAAIIGYNALSKQYKAQTPSEKASSEGSESNEEEQTAAPDFTVLDRDGHEVQLSEYFGKPVVINFWATWCGPCKSELPAFDNLYQEYGDEIHFLMVNLTDGSRETIEGVEAYLSETGYTFPVYFDTEYIASYTYGAYSIPLSVFIDSGGNIVQSHVGAMDEDTLRAYIDLIVE
ncbi:MAG: TlpA family protein disulfide reductase [Ruminococcus sp.]|nr:TlpA family protein disulfide reductase [Ruminococcus sp.]